MVRDLIRGEVRFNHRDLDDFIIMKSNGLPTYNFASVVDDAEMKITDVIRAEEHLSNTPRQQRCAWRRWATSSPATPHVPMILAPDRSKLSKRHGATSVEEFRSAQYSRSADQLYGLLVGHREKEILPLSEMIRYFH